jgi:hypothetical protein
MFEFRFSFCTIAFKVGRYNEIGMKEENVLIICSWTNFTKKPGPGACIIKLTTAVIYGFRNKLECLSMNTRLGWKELPGTKTLAYYGNRKLRP